MSIGIRLKEARKALKLRQEDFAARCHISRNGQAKFERDENQPGAAYLLALEALGIDAGYVLTGRPSARNDEETALLHAFRQAGDSTRQWVLQGLGLSVDTRGGCE